MSTWSSAASCRGCSRQHGLVDVAADAYFPLALPAAAALDCSNVDQVRAGLVGLKVASDEEIDGYLAAAAEGAIDVATPPLVSVWGRRGRVTATRRRTRGRPCVPYRYQMITTASTIDTIEALRYVPWSRRMMAKIGADDVEHLVDQRRALWRCGCRCAAPWRGDRDQPADDRPIPIDVIVPELSLTSRTKSSLLRRRDDGDPGDDAKDAGDDHQDRDDRQQDRPADATYVFDMLTSLGCR